MVRVILHVGMPKTGSTSIQAAFAERRELLASHGFFYPKLDAGANPGHWALGAFWRDQMLPDYYLTEGLDRLGPPEKVLADVRREILQAIRKAEEFGDGVVLLSDEHLTHPHAGPGCMRLNALMRRQDCDMTILAYLRPDPDLIPSATQQQLKLYRRMLDISTMSHLKRLEDLTRYLGARRQRLRVFGRESLTGGDAVTDFCQWIGQVAGRPVPEFQGVARVNESIPAPGCALLQRLSAAATEDSDKFAFVKVRWAVMQSHADIPAPRLTLPAGWRQRIEAHSHVAWNAMLSRTEHPQELRDRLRMPRPDPDLPPAGPQLTSRDLCDWVAAQGDPAYDQGLRDWIAALSEPWTRRALALLDGLAAP